MSPGFSVCYANHSCCEVSEQDYFICTQTAPSLFSGLPCKLCVALHEKTQCEVSSDSGFGKHVAPVTPRNKI